MDHPTTEVGRRAEQGKELIEQESSVGSSNVETRKEKIQGMFLDNFLCLTYLSPVS